MANITLEKLNNIIKSLESFSKSYKKLCDIADTGKVANSNEYPKLFAWVKFIMDKDPEIEKGQPYRALTFYKDNEYMQSLCIVGHINDNDDTLYLLSRLKDTYCFEKMKEKVNSITGIKVLENICEQKLKCFKTKKNKILDSRRFKNQISRLRKKLSQGKVWVKFEHDGEINHNEGSYIKRIEYYYVKSFVEYPSSIPNTCKFIYDERIIMDYKITNNKVTYAYDPVWQNTKQYKIVTDRKFKIISKIPKKVMVSVTEYVTKERKRINEWSDRWFNLVKYEKHA